MTNLLTMDLIDLMDYCRNTSPTYEECSRKFLDVCEAKQEARWIPTKKEVKERFLDLGYVWNNRGMYDLYRMDADFDPIKLEEYKRRGGVR